MGITLRRRGWFRAPARCRSEAPTGRTGRRSKARLAMRVSRPSAACWHDAASSGLVSRSRALGDPRDAGRRPALHGSPGDASLAAFGRGDLVSRSARCRSETGAPRLAWRCEARGLRPRVGRTLRSGLVSRSRAMPVGGPHRDAMGGSRPSPVRHDGLAWHAALGLVSRSRAMPVGEPAPRVGMTLRHWGWFRAHQEPVGDRRS